jgi:hypothetical protein
MRLVALVLVCSTLCAQTKPLPKDRSEDSYAVYTAVMAKPQLSHPNDNRKYLIHDATSLGEDKPGACIRVPADYTAKLEEILAEFSQYKAESFQLERKFEVDRPYELLTEAEAKQFSDDRMRSHLGETEPEKFRGAVDLLSFGNVYFDRSRTMAVVRTGAWCGGLCGLWVWRVLVREDGRWQDKPWSTCVTMAQDQGFGELKNPTLSTLASTATSKKPTIISSQLCSPQRTSALGSGLRGLLAELSK